MMSWPPVRPHLPVLGGTSGVPTIYTMLATKILLTSIELLYKECDLRQPTSEETLKATMAFE